MRSSPRSPAHHVSTLSSSEPMWTLSSISGHDLVPERRHRRGLIDTSVVIDLALVDPARLPAEIAVSAVTMAELAAGPHTTDDVEERARRQDRLQRTEATFESLPVDRAVARACGRVYAAVAATGKRSPRRRAFDLLIAATALAEDLPLYRRNPRDFVDVDSVVDVVSVPVT